jgi:hypothetical protein
MIVLWDGPVDALEHPTAGLIGPVPFRRVGAHTPDGFVFVCPPGSGRPGQDHGGTPHPPTAGTSLDVPPTILTLLGLPIPEGMDGRSLVIPLGVT